MDSCPHLRRQRNFHRAFLAQLVVTVLINSTIWPDEDAPIDVIGVGTGLGMVVLAVVLGFKPVRAWFGWGQHTEQPDEREALVAAHAKARTHDLMMLSMPFALMGLLIALPHQRALAYGVIGMFTVMIAGAWWFTRRFNTLM